MSDLHVVDASELPVQATFLPSPPGSSPLPPVVNRHPRKPAGGLWTSTYLGTGLLSDWWLKKSGEMPEMFDGRGLYILRPAAGANILVLDTVADAVAVYDRYGSAPRPDASELLYRLDFLAMAREGFAGVRVTGPGLAANSIGESLVVLNEWDCESTVWWACPRGDWEQLEWTS